jgi:predicted ArsR family transcriptional regulator
MAPRRKEGMKDMTEHIRTTEKILLWFQEKRKATVDDCEVALGLSHQSCSARIHDLEITGYLLRTKERKKTRTGRTAWIFELDPSVEVLTSIT